jgi:hypothetical protein
MQVITNVWYLTYMDDALLDVVVQRLEELPLPDEASDLLLAALDGDDALAMQLEAVPAQRYVPDESAETGPAPSLDRHERHAPRFRQKSTRALVPEAATAPGLPRRLVA